jgi:hypothetical protein
MRGQTFPLKQQHVRGLGRAVAGPHGLEEVQHGLEAVAEGVVASLSPLPPRNARNTCSASLCTNIDMVPLLMLMMRSIAGAGSLTCPCADS